ncbi:MAG: universal stress protein [Coriobacteriia bacterium]
MLTTMLVPVDFTDDSALVISAAAGLTGLGVRRVVLVHVVEASGMEGPAIAKKVDSVREGLRKDAERLRACGLDVEVRVPAGDEFHELLVLASELHADGILCGSHGKTVVDQLVAGSVPERMLRDGTIPGLVVRFALLRQEEDPAEPVRRFGSKLLVPTDFSATASRAFSTVTGLPAKSVGSLHLLHVIDSGLTGEKLRKAEDGAEFHLRNLAAMAAEKGMAATVAIRCGEPARAILAEMNERRVTGVAVGTRGRAILAEPLLGSVSMTLLRQASCPVMIVP